MYGRYKDSKEVIIVQIEKYQTPHGSYIKLLFTQEKEYRYMLNIFTEYEMELIRKAKDHSDVKVIVNALIEGRIDDAEFAVVIVIRPYIYINLLMAFYEELKMRSAKEVYKDLYEAKKIINEENDKEIAQLKSEIEDYKQELEYIKGEAEISSKKYKYEIKRLKSELKKYTGEE